MVEVSVYNTAGEVVDTIGLSDDVFGVTPNRAVVHQALVRQLANARQGTVNTKTRSYVAGGGRKPFRQKGTGRARRGSSRSPLLKGGGIIFGPHPRDHRQAMPKKMRRLAIRGVLSAKVADGEVVVVDQLSLERPRTKEMVGILRALSIDRSVLIVTADANPNVYRSARNIERSKTLPATQLNVADLLTYRKLLITVPAIRKVEEVWTPPQRERDTDTGKNGTDRGE